MPNPIPRGLRLGIVEPAEAVAAFERRKLLEPSFAWQDVWQDEHSRGFAVAGVMRLDVLETIRAAIEPAITAGKSLRDFQKELEPALAAKGFWGDVEITDPKTGDMRTTRFDRRRLELIYGVNLRQAMAAGRWERIERGKDRFPFVVYRTMGDERVRFSHRAWDGAALPVGHPFWRTHYPPNGWRCRCRAYGIDQRGLDRLRAAGVPIKTEAPPIDYVPYVNPRTGEVSAVPRGIDPGFAYNPGQKRDQAFVDGTLRKAVAAHPLAAASAVARAQADRPGFVAEATLAFGAFVDSVLASGQAANRTVFIGALKAPAVRALRDQGTEPATAAVAVRDADVLHALRRSKQAQGVAIDASVYRRLPELLERAEALLIEAGAQPPALLYVVDLVRDDGSVAKLVVTVDMPVKTQSPGGLRRRVRLNLVRTATLMIPAALRDRTRYRLLWGRIDEDRQ